MCLVYSSACGNQLIRFSYATNMSRPQESGYMQATYKKRKNVKHTIWYHSCMYVCIYIYMCVCVCVCLCVRAWITHNNMSSKTNGGISRVSLYYFCASINSITLIQNTSYTLSHFYLIIHQGLERHYCFCWNSKLGYRLPRVSSTSM